ncbi:MAG: IS1182 family transposase [Ignavibacteriales bacterium]|nr:IS1182 family transposase [Ignavibacteriales bacterium]
MEHVNGTPRDQIALFPEAVEDYISADNPVRFLDVFVDSLDTVSLGFQHANLNETGRPAYNPKDLLKLYLYGYLNRIRSSRMLERETKRNLELLWLLKRLTPDHKTISDFRRRNAEALRAVFKQFVLSCSKLELFGAELVAIDSTKFKASNARDRVKDREQLDNTIVRISESIGQYLAQLEESDQREKTTASPSVTKEALQAKIARLHNQKAQLQEARQGLDENGAKYTSLTDPDCRLMKNEHRIAPAYAMQAAVDAKHSLIIDYELTQDAADNNHLSSVAAAAKEMLGVETLTVCADAGYYDTVDLKTCDDQGITTYVSIPAPKIPKHTNVPTPDYYHDRFVYDEATDTYRCPAEQTLGYYCTTDKSDARRIRIYRTEACIACHFRSACTTSPRGRYINRWEHEAVLDRLKQRLASQPEIIKHRKAIIEHIFGTIKKIWGYSALLLRGLANIAGEVALMNLSYNIRRVLNIVGTRKLILALQHT